MKLEKRGKIPLKMVHCQKLFRVLGNGKGRLHGKIICVGAGVIQLFENVQF